MILNFKQSIDILIFDADDTLWENNIYYIRTMDALFDMAIDVGHSRQEVEERFYICEHKMVMQYGYGSEVFIKILQKFFSEFHGFEDSMVNRFEQIISEFKSNRDRKPDLFPGVAESLTLLNGNFINYILTKGNHQEQLRKIQMSGLLEYFEDYFIEPEKNIGTLQRIMMEQKWIPERVCMIGNSPKSDINPALELGLNAIFIPYAHTWKLDNEDVKIDHPKLHTIEHFADLPRLLLA